MPSTRSSTPDGGSGSTLMRVEFYSPERLYGFAETGQARVFFHLGAFVAGHWPGLNLAPPPILGEEVRVEYDPSSPQVERAPKAVSVERIAPPTAVHGIVESFNAERGWGFARGDDGESYYLHRCEVEDGRLPLQGQAVDFYKGHKKGRPRACYVRVGRLVG